MILKVFTILPNSLYDQIQLKYIMVFPSRAPTMREGRGRKGWRGQRSPARQDTTDRPPAMQQIKSTAEQLLSVEASAAKGIGDGMSPQLTTHAGARVLLTRRYVCNPCGCTCVTHTATRV